MADTIEVMGGRFSLGAVCALALSVWSSPASAAEAPATAAAAAASSATVEVAAATAASASSSSAAVAAAQEPQKDRVQKDAPPKSTLEEQDTAISEVEQAVSVFRRETERYGARDDGEGGGRSRRTASGSSWHGRIYEYLRNNGFDAVPHEVVQNGGERNILRRNQFGVSVSGPVVVPKLYDGRRSTFFTFSYEGTRESVGRSYLRTLPTSGQRTGDFSDLVNKAGDPVVVYDPATTRQNPLHDPAQPVSRGNLEWAREPFPNNRIPLSRIDPVAEATARHYPAPNVSVGPFLQNNYWSNPAERNAPDGFLAKLDHNLLNKHKVTLDLAHSRGFQGQPRIFDTAANPGDPDLNFLNRSVSLRETFAISPNAVYTARFGVASEEIETVGLDDGRNLPQEIGLQGVRGTVFPSLRFVDFYGMGAPSGSFRRNAQNTYRLGHELTWRRGKHSWTFDSTARWYGLNTLELDSPSGQFRFNDELTGLPGVTKTGSSYAGFLLGLAAEAEATDQLQPTYLRRFGLDSSVRDDIELSPNLTASLSVQVDVNGPRLEKYDRQSTLDPDAINPENGLAGALVFAGRDGYDRAFQPTRTTIEPRLGVTWSPDANRDTVVRATVMRYFSQIPLRTGPFGTQGFSGRRTPISPNKQLAPAVTLAEGMPLADHALPDLRGDAANNTDVDLQPQNGALPRYHYLSLSLERRLPLGMTVRASGSAYRGRNMLIGGSVLGLNRIPLEGLGYRDALNNEAFRRTLRPFPQYQEVEADGSYPDGRYANDIGVFSVEKQTGEGLSFDLSYQYQRRYDDYSGPGVQNPFDRSTAWALSRGTRPHRVSLSYMYELPFGDGNGLLGGSSWLGSLLSDWSVSGFTTWLSGDPIALSPIYNNTGGIVPYLRVNSVPGVDAHLDDPNPFLWFNPAAFAHPDDFTIGDVPRTHPTLLNPSWQNHDLAVTKRVPLSSEKSLELLFQGFNFLNHANWNDPDATIGTAEAPNVNAGRIIGSRGGRVLQLGVRYNF